MDRPWVDDLPELPELFAAALRADPILVDKVPGGFTLGGSSVDRTPQQYTSGGLYPVTVRVRVDTVQWSQRAPRQYESLVELAMDTDYLGREQDQVYLLFLLRRMRWVLDHRTLASDAYPELQARPYRQCQPIFWQQGLSSAGREEMAKEHMVQIYKVGHVD